jgi:Ribosomal RNA adenine dimethylase
MANAAAATACSVWYDSVRRGRSGVNRFHRCHRASPGWAHLVQTTLVPAVLEGTELGRRVLEIGPGPGLTTEILAGVAPQLTAIEIDPTLAKATRNRVPAARVVQCAGSVNPLCWSGNANTSENSAPAEVERPPADSAPYRGW